MAGLSDQWQKMNFDALMIQTTESPANHKGSSFLVFPMSNCFPNAQLEHYPLLLPCSESVNRFSIELLANVQPSAVFPEFEYPLDQACNVNLCDNRNGKCSQQQFSCGVMISSLCYKVLGPYYALVLLPTARPLLRSPLGRKIQRRWTSMSGLSYHPQRKTW